MIKLHNKKYLIFSLALLLLFAIAMLLFFEHKQIQQIQKQVFLENQSTILLKKISATFKQRCTKMHMDIFHNQKGLDDYESLIQSQAYWHNLFQANLSDLEKDLINSLFSIQPIGSLLQDNFQIKISLKIQDKITYPLFQSMPKSFS